MPRIAALILCAIAALVASGTPAPQPRPWFTAWDKPVDRKGDCRFERKGGELTITVPGPGHEINDLTVPRLLRDVEGDFVVEVRVSGDSWFQRETIDDWSFLRQAGIVVLGGEKLPAVFLAFEGQTSKTDNWHAVCGIRPSRRGGGVSLGGFSLPPKKSASLRLERREDLWRMSYTDGKEWPHLHTLRANLPRKLKVGVFAEATALGTFKVVFDQFKLTRLSK